MKKYRAFISIIFLIHSLTFAQEKKESLKNEATMDSEAFELKYLKMYKSVPQILDALRQTNDLIKKRHLIVRLCDFLSDDKAFATVIQQVSFYMPVKGLSDPSWKIRTAAIHLLGKRGGSLSVEEQIKILKLAKEHYLNDPNKRVVTASINCLIRLAKDEPDKTSKHKLFNKRTIAYLISERLMSLKKTENYLCWTLSRASVKLGDPFCLIALKVVRKKTFKPVVLSEIQKSIKALKKVKN